MSSQETISLKLESALNFLKEWVAPNATAIDQGEPILGEILREMGSQRLMALKIPEASGGAGLDEHEFRQFQEECARASGTFAFLQTQHQSGASLIAKGENQELTSEYLPKMASGEKTVGIGFSQLRRPGPPALTATPAEGGYVLNGTVPWATGWNYFQEMLVGATLPDGRALFALTPFHTRAGIELSQPMKLAAMEAANTVSIQFQEFLVPEAQCVMIKPIGWIANNDMINIALQGHFAIGCALAGLDILATVAEKRPSSSLTESLDRLRTELANCREATARAQSPTSEETTDERLRVRAWAIDLAFRCAQAAVVSSSGASNSLHHPAQRVYREALVFSVSAQTSAIRDASLERLIR